jgi:hypothetical protein
VGVGVGVWPRTGPPNKKTPAAHKKSAAIRGLIRASGRFFIVLILRSRLAVSLEKT